MRERGSETERVEFQKRVKMTFAYCFGEERIMKDKVKGSFDVYEKQVIVAFFIGCPRRDKLLLLII